MNADLVVDGLFGSRTREAFMALEPELQDSLTSILTCISAFPTVKEEDTMSKVVMYRQIAEAIVSVAREFDIDKMLLLGFAKIESSYNTHAVNGSSRGLFQFQTAAWSDADRVLGGGRLGSYEANWQDAYRSALALAGYLKFNYSILQKAGIGRVTMKDLYLAHQQGAAGLMTMKTAAHAGKSDVGLSKSHMLRNTPPGFPDTVSTKQFYANWWDYLDEIFPRNGVVRF